MIEIRCYGCGSIVVVEMFSVLVRQGMNGEEVDRTPLKFIIVAELS